MKGLYLLFGDKVNKGGRENDKAVMSQQQDGY